MSWRGGWGQGRRVVLFAANKGCHPGDLTGWKSLPVLSSPPQSFHSWGVVSLSPPAPQPSLPPFFPCGWGPGIAGLPWRNLLGHLAHIPWKWNLACPWPSLSLPGQLWPPPRASTPGGHPRLQTPDSTALLCSSRLQEQLLPVGSASGLGGARTPQSNLLWTRQPLSDSFPTCSWVSHPSSMLGSGPPCPVCFVAYTLNPYPAHLAWAHPRGHLSNSCSGLAAGWGR